MGNTLEGASANIDIVIIGCGPTGMGAAFRLKQHECGNWLLLDAEKHPGGLAGSTKTPQGFCFDHGYKVLRSRYEYFDKVLETIYDKKVDGGLERCPDDDFVFIRGTMIKSPLQNNLGALPTAEKNASVIDLVKAKLASSDPENAFTPNNLDDFLVSEWGEALCNYFFRPYIYKSWAYPTGKLSYSWVSAKIPQTNLGDEFNKILGKQQKDSDMEDCRFKPIKFYPKKGGLVGLWQCLAKTLPSQNIRFQNEIAELDVEAKMLKTKDGLEIRYKQLLSTMPLNALLDICGRSDLSSCLVHSSLFVVCLGIRGTTHHEKVKGCIYFPESDTTFHRVCVVSNRDPDAVPQETEKLSTIRLAGSVNNDSNQDPSPMKDVRGASGPYWSLMLEVSGGPLKAIDDKTIVDNVLRDAVAVGLLRGDDEIVSMHLTEITYGCPLPTIASAEKVDEALSWLRSKDIWSRGRFGAFKYERGDIDQCFIQGVEAVDNILQGKPERSIYSSDDAASSLQQTLPRFEVQSVDEASNLSSTSGTGNSLTSDDEKAISSESSSSVDIVTSEQNNFD